MFYFGMIKEERLGVTKTFHPGLSCSMHGSFQIHFRNLAYPKYYPAGHSESKTHGKLSSQPHKPHGQISSEITVHPDHGRSCKTSRVKKELETPQICR